jgi:hypothetical protein
MRVSYPSERKATAGTRYHARRQWLEVIHLRRSRRTLGQQYAHLLDVLARDDFEAVDTSPMIVDPDSGELQ